MLIHYIKYSLHWVNGLEALMYTFFSCILHNIGPTLAKVMWSPLKPRGHSVTTYNVYEEGLKRRRRKKKKLSKRQEEESGCGPFI